MANGKPWTEQEAKAVKAFIKSTKPNSFPDWEALAKQLDRTPGSCRHYACAQKLYVPTVPHRHWEPNEIKIVEDFVERHKRAKGNLNWNLLEGKLNRSPNACRHYAIAQGIYSYLSGTWSPEEEAYLTDICVSGNFPFEKAVKLFNQKAKQSGWASRSKISIQRKVERLGYSLARNQLSEFLTVPTIYLGLGYPTDWKVRHWIDKGMLPAIGGESTLKRYLVRIEDFVKFALESPYDVSKNITPEGAEWLLKLIREFVSIKRKAKDDSSRIPPTEISKFQRTAKRAS